MIIGQSNYKYCDLLTNCQRDAHGMAEALSLYSFELSEYLNLNQESFKNKIDERCHTLGKYDMPLFYFSGHGLYENEDSARIYGS